MVLFDEIEKGHPEVLDVLLQVLDEGRLTDARGRPADFREAVIVLSSNLGAAEALEERVRFDGFAPAEPGAPAAFDPRRVLDAVAAHLRPELLNRIGHKIVFAPLGEAALEEVVERAVAALERRLAERRVRIDLPGEARRAIARLGRDPRYGAREVHRVVDRLVAQPLAQAILDGRAPPGATVRIEARPDGTVALAMESTGAHS